MFKIRLLIFGFLFLFSQLNVIARDKAKIERLLAQKNHTAEWHKEVLAELRSNRYVIEPNILLQYINKLDALYQADLKSAERFESLLLKLNILSKLGQYDTAIKEANKMIDALGSSAKSQKYASIWIEIADLYYLKGKLDSVADYLSIAKDLVKEDSQDYYHWVMSKASEVYSAGSIAEAVKLTQQAIRYFEKVGDDNSLAVAYNNLADNYTSLNQPLEAAKYFLEAAEINKKIGNKHSLCMNYNNAGSVFSKANQLDNAINYYQMAYEMAKELKDPMLMAQNIMNRGNVYEKKGDYAKAKKSFMDCLAICEENGIDFGKMLSYINLGNVSYLSKDYVEAEIYLNRALDLTQRMGLPQQRALVYDKQSKLYFARGDYREAYEMQQKFHSLNDSLFNEKTQKEILTLKEQFESEKNINKINQLTREKLRQQLIIALMGIGVLLLFLVLQRLRLKHQLAKKQDELQKAYLHAKLDGKDKELTAQAAQLLQMQNDLDQSISKLVKLIDGKNVSVEDKLKQIKSTLQKNPVSGFNADFDKRITEANADFYKILLAKYPDLSPTELKLCAYLRLSISTKEIAQLTNRSVRTVETLRSDIRKKMNLTANDNLSNHLISLA